MSEQQIQNSELSKPIYLDENAVYNLGATTLGELALQHKINAYSADSIVLRKKPDGVSARQK